MSALVGRWFDPASRLQSIAYWRTDGSLLEQIDYAYDANGRRTEKRQGGDTLKDTALEASYDSANRLTRITLNPGANARTYDLSYDASGNLLSKTNPADPADTSTYTWNARNQLVALQPPTVQASYRYDPQGRRIARTINGDTVHFLYDGVQAIAELRNNAVSAAYHPGIGIDEVLARYTSQGQKTLLQDALGSVIAQTDETQQASNWYAYSPYGETQTVGPDDANPLQYTGRENDRTGLYYYRARYYDPVLKRFISEDPIGLRGGINFYAYAGGNPVSLIDPSGNFNLPAAGVGAAIGAVAGGTTAYFEGGNAGDIAVAASLGALSGATAGATLGTAGSIVVGAASGGLGSLIGQWVSGDTVNWGKVGGAVLAGATGGGASALSKRAGQGAIGEALTGGLAGAEAQAILDLKRSLDQQYKRWQQCR